MNWLTTNTKRYSEEPKLKKRQISNQINNWKGMLGETVFFLDTFLLPERKIVFYWDENAQHYRDSIQIN